MALLALPLKASGACGNTTSTRVHTRKGTQSYRYLLHALPLKASGA